MAELGINPERLTFSRNNLPGSVADRFDVDQAMRKAILGSSGKPGQFVIHGRDFS
jgi:hypothetical protein